MWIHIFCWTKFFFSRTSIEFSSSTRVWRKERNETKAAAENLFSFFVSHSFLMRRRKGEKESIKINNNWKNKKIRKEKKNFFSPSDENEKKVEKLFLTHSENAFETCVLLSYVKIINFFPLSPSLPFLFFLRVLGGFHFTMSYGHD